MEKSIKYSEIILHGIFTLFSVIIIYYICERLKIVPIIDILLPNSVKVDGYEITIAESILMALIIIQIVWVGSSFIFFKFIRKYEVEW